MDASEEHKKLKSASMRIVVVVWRDAHADGGSWLSVDEIEDEPYIVESVGFVLEGVKSGHVSICQSLGDDDGVVDHVLHIPDGMIVRVTNLSECLATMANNEERQIDEH